MDNVIRTDGYFFILGVGQQKSKLRPKKDRHSGVRRPALSQYPLVDNILRIAQSRWWNDRDRISMVHHRRHNIPIL